MSAVRGPLNATLIALGTIAAMVASPATASAFLLMPFTSDECAWYASHIIVVTEGEKIDGEVEVLESWKGDLKKGDRIAVPELAVFAPVKERTVSYRWGRKKKDGEVDQVTCSRLVLFLIKDHEQEFGGKPRKVIWRPADPWGKEVEVSLAFVEKERIYAFAQIVNPGPRELLPWGISEKEFRTSVEKVLKAQTELPKALAQTDANKLSDGLLPILKTDSWFVRKMVIEASAKAGTTALPALRMILQDDNLASHHCDAVLALAKAGGGAVGPELTEMLKEDLVYWKKIGPDLKEGWRNGSDEKTLRLNARFDRTYDTLHALKELRITGSKETVIALRDFWRSLPQLTPSQLDKQCDEVLEEFRRPGAPITAP